MTASSSSVVLTALLALCFFITLITIIVSRRRSVRSEAILLLLGLGAVGSLGAWKQLPIPATAASVAGDVVAGCASIRTGLTAKELRAKMGEPESVVSEEAALGPDAEAWLYVDRGCVAHLMDSQVNWVEYE